MLARVNPSRTRWPRGRWTWLLGTIALVTIAAIIGLILGNVWLGLALGTIVSLVWFFAYESRRGRNAGVNDEDRGIEL